MFGDGLSQFTSSRVSGTDDVHLRGSVVCSWGWKGRVVQAAQLTLNPYGGRLQIGGMSYAIVEIITNQWC